MGGADSVVPAQTGRGKQTFVKETGLEGKKKGERGEKKGGKSGSLNFLFGGKSKGTSAAPARRYDQEGEKGNLEPTKSGGTFSKRVKGTPKGTGPNRGKKNKEIKLDLPTRKN